MCKSPPTTKRTNKPTNAPSASEFSSSSSNMSSKRPYIHSWIQLFQHLHTFCSSPKAQSIFCMTLASAIHFAGHEWVRSASVTLFTSKEYGFESAAAVPLGVGCVSPFSVLLLWSFTKMIHSKGPRYALVKSTLVGASFMAFVAITLHALHSNKTPMISQHSHHTLQKALVFAQFVFQSANVQLLFTQHWSFVSSVLTPKEGTVWFAPIAGVGSVISTLAAAHVSTVVDAIGLTYCLGLAAILIACSSWFADRAYRIAAKNGFEPQPKNVSSSSSTSTTTTTTTTTNDTNTPPPKQTRPRRTQNVFKTAKDLVERVPIFRALACEMICSQCLSSVLNLQFVLKVKSVIVDDVARAGWTGNCYAWINGVSGLLQFCILPLITKHVEPQWFWLCMPLSVLFFTVTHWYVGSSLSLVAITFFTMKTMEYSLRGQASEMLYVTLDYESRFIGKEIINLFANRLGKSGTAICLFLITTQLEQDESKLEKFLTLGSNLVGVLWLCSSLSLTKLLRTKV